MPRKKFIENNQFPFHVSSRSINKDWFELPMNEVWEIFCRNLYFTKHAYNLKIHSFVLMNNHFHLILSTPNLNLSESMKYFISNVSREIRYKSGRINHIFRQKFFRSQVTNDIHYYNIYKYVYRNPIEAGLCKKAEDYKYSTLHGLLGKSHLFIPLEEDTTLFENNYLFCLNWINTAPNEQSKNDIKCALKKGTFKLRKDINTKKDNVLNYELY